MVATNVPVLPDSSYVIKVLENKMIEHSVKDIPFAYKKYYYNLLKLAYANCDNLFQYNADDRCFVCEIPVRKFARLLGMSNGTVASDFMKFIESLGLISRSFEVTNKPLVTFIYVGFFV